MGQVAQAPTTFRRPQDRRAHRAAVCLAWSCTDATVLQQGADSAAMSQGRYTDRRCTRPNHQPSRSGHHRQPALQRQGTDNARRVAGVAGTSLHRNNPALRAGGSIEPIEAEFVQPRATSAQTSAEPVGGRGVLSWVFCSGIGLHDDLSRGGHQTDDDRKLIPRVRALQKGIEHAPIWIHCVFRRKCPGSSAEGSRVFRHCGIDVGRLSWMEGKFRLECRVGRVGNSEVVLAEVCRIVVSSDYARTFRSASIDLSSRSRKCGCWP